MGDASRKLTKRTVDAAQPTDGRYIVWDTALKGFGLRVEASGTKTFILRYRPRGEAASQKRFMTIGRLGALTPEEARLRAKSILGDVANGRDPARDRVALKEAPSIAKLYDEFEALHVRPKLKPSTVRSYRSLYDVYLAAEWGRRRATDLTSGDLVRWQAKMVHKPAPANRVLSLLSAMFSWSEKNGFVPKGSNPCIGVDRFTEAGRERYLNAQELERLGAAIREAEMIGIPWEIEVEGDNAKHVPANRSPTPIGADVAAALRLLLLTGARLKEIIHLKWEWVDFEHGALVLPNSKTGRRVIYLNGPASTILHGLPRLGPYVFPGRVTRAGEDIQDRPRGDLKRPWEGIRRMAGLGDVRLHDLRHTHASVGVGGGLSLQIVAKLLGHSQLSTTQRYSHLADDPIRRASEAIGAHLTSAMGD